MSAASGVLTPSPKNNSHIQNCPVQFDWKKCAIQIEKMFKLNRNFRKSKTQSLRCHPIGLYLQFFVVLFNFYFSAAARFFFSSLRSFVRWLVRSYNSFIRLCYNAKPIACLCIFSVGACVFRCWSCAMCICKRTNTHINGLLSCWVPYRTLTHVLDYPCQCAVAPSRPFQLSYLN